MTDLGLPGMSGDRLAAEARRMNANLKIIFATGADGAPVIPGETGTENAITLRKPYDGASLDLVLRAAGDRRGRRNR
jgi:FixJ family two-component response regulator